MLDVSHGTQSHFGCREVGAATPHPQNAPFAILKNSIIFVSLLLLNDISYEYGNDLIGKIISYSI